MSDEPSSVDDILGTMDKGDIKICILTQLTLFYFVCDAVELSKEQSQWPTLTELFTRVPNVYQIWRK